MPTTRTAFGKSFVNPSIQSSSTIFNKRLQQPAMHETLITMMMMTMQSMSLMTMIIPCTATTTTIAAYHIQLYKFNSFLYISQFTINEGHPKFLFFGLLDFSRTYESSVSEMRIVCDYILSPEGRKSFEAESGIPRGAETD